MTLLTIDIALCWNCWTDQARLCLDDWNDDSLLYRRSTTRARLKLACGGLSTTGREAPLLVFLLSTQPRHPYIPVAPERITLSCGHAFGLPCTRSSKARPKDPPLLSHYARLLVPVVYRFYSNLITKNIAMGGDVDKSAKSAFTAGSKRHAATDEYEMQDGNEQAAATAKRKEAAAAADGSEGGPANGASQGGRDGDDAVNSPGRTDESDGLTARMVDPRAGEPKNSTRDEEGVRDSERSGRRRDQSEEAVDNVAKRARRAGEASDGGDASVAGDGRAEQQQQDERTDEEKSAAAAADKAREAAAAKAKKEAAVKAARERFLARKKAA